MLFATFLLIIEILYCFSPCLDVKAPKKDTPEWSILTIDQFQKVRDYIRNKPEELPIMLAASCGMRLGEIFGLRWEDIDFSSGIIKVRKTLVKVDSEYIEKGPKSESGKRDIIATDEILKLLKHHQKQTGDISGRVIKDEYPDLLSRKYERLIKKLNLPHTRLHDLRHFNATMMLKGGVSDKEAATRLGHSDTNMTKKYQHVLDNMKNKPAEILDSIVKRDVKSDVNNSESR